MSKEPNEIQGHEESATDQPVPVWLIVLFALLAYSGMLYLNGHAGEFDPMVYPPFNTREDLVSAQPSKGPEEEIVKQGKLVFLKACAVCHQDTGLGSTTSGCPPLDGSEWVIGGGPNRIIRLVLNGGAGPIEVKKEIYPGANGMTPFANTPLTDKDIACALSYIRQAWGNKGKGAGLVTEEQVKAVRAAVKDRSGPWNSAELLKIPDKDEATPTTPAAAR